MFELCVRWLAWGLDTSLKAALVALAAAALLQLLRLRDSNIRHRIWTGVLAGMLALPVLTPLMPALRLPLIPSPDWLVAWTAESAVSEPTAAFPSSEAVPTDSPVASRPLDPHQLPPISTLDPDFDPRGASPPHSFPAREAALAPEMATADRAPHSAWPAEPVAEPLPAAPVPRSPASGFGPSLRTAMATCVLVASGIWFLVCAFLCLRLAIGLWMAVRLRHASIGIDPADLPPIFAAASVRECPGIHVPLTVGAFAPQILLPTDWRRWPLEKLLAVLAHEQMHVQRADCAVALIAEINCCLYWFHPLAWWLKQQLAALAEQACDDAAIHSIGNRTQYARHLLEVAAAVSRERGRLVPYGVSMARRSSVETRIRAILDFTRPLSKRLTWTSTLLLLGVMIPLIALAAALKPLSESNAESQSQASVSTEDPSSDAAEPATEQTQGRDAQSNDDAGTSTAGASFTFSGNVVDDRGQPVRAAEILLGDWSDAPLRERSPQLAVSDDHGKFQFSKTAAELAGSTDSRGWFVAQLIAVKSGHGFAQGLITRFETSGRLMSELTDDQRDRAQRDAAKNSRILTLVPDAPVRGRILNTEGQPVSGATIEVLAVAEGIGGSLDDWLAATKENNADYYSARRHLNHLTSGRFNTGPRWVVIPPPKTDDDGRFTLSGLGRERIAEIFVSGPGIETNMLHVRSSAGDVVSLPYEQRNPDHLIKFYPREFSHVAGPSHPVTGHVTDRATGQPIAGAVVRADKIATHYVHGSFNATYIRALTDADGQYRLEGLPLGSNSVLVLPPPDSRYLASAFAAESSAQSEPLVKNVALTSGVMVRGRVTDGRTGQPLSGYIQYFAFDTNPHLNDAAGFSRAYLAHHYRSAPDGRYQIPVLPGGGLLTFMADKHADYPRGIGADRIDGPKSVTNAVFFLTVPARVLADNYHLLAPLDPAEGATELDLDLTLHSGLTLTGRLRTQGGQPLGEYYLYGQNAFAAWNNKRTGETFQVKSYSPAEGRRVMVYHPAGNLVGLKDLTGDPPDNLEIVLQPGAKLVGRIIDTDGMPLEDLFIGSEWGKFNIGARYSPHVAKTWGEMPTQLEGRQLRTDKNGRFELPGIIPGLEYSAAVSANQKRNGQSQMMSLGSVFKDITAEPGQTKDLGDLMVRKEQPQDQRQSKVLDSTKKVASATTHVTGQITDSAGQPLAAAHVAVIGWPTQPQEGVENAPRAEIIADGKTDDAGRFQLPLPNVSSKSHEPTFLIARGANTAVAWQKLNFGALPNHISVTLLPEEPVRVRLIDIDGQPAAGARLEVGSVMKRVNGELTEEGVGYGGESVHPAWIAPLIADQEGRFTIHGLARDQGIWLYLEASDRFAPQGIFLNSGLPEERPERDATYRDIVRNVKPGEEVIVPLSPAQVIEGTIRYEDSREPVPHALVSVWASQQRGGGSMSSVEGKTDAEGHYRISAHPGIRFGVMAYAPTGAPYLIRRTTEDIRWENGDRVKQQDLTLPPGVLIRGKVLTAGSGSPIANAAVQFLPQNSATRARMKGVVTGWQGIQYTDKDGGFQIAVPPGPGHLLVNHDTGSYVLQEIGGMALDSGKPGGERYYAHAIKKIDPAPDARSLDMTIELQPGAIVAGLIVDPNGQPVDEVRVVSRLHIWSHWLNWHGSTRGRPGPPTGGRFELKGLQEGLEYPTHFLDPKRRLGATVNLKAADAEPTIVLQPCGSATVRFVDPEGQPLADHRPNFDFIATPGAHRYDSESLRSGQLAADSDFAANVDRANHGNLRTDADGKLTIPALIPGATYALSTVSKGRWQVAKEFQVHSGQSLDLGDIVQPSPDAKAKSTDTAAAKPAHPLPLPLGEGRGEGVKAAAELVAVTGIVLRPNGKPAAGATIRAAAPLWASMEPLLGKDFKSPISEVRTDSDGRFTISFTSQPFGDVTQLDQQWQQIWKKTAIAASLPGFGPAWVAYDEITPNQPLTLKLVEDLPIRGRVIDLEGRPIAGTTVKIGEPQAAKDDDLSAWIAGIKAGELSNTVWQKAPRKIESRLIDAPTAVTTDAKGMFEIRGIGRERFVALTFVGETVAHRGAKAVTRPMETLHKVVGLPRISATEPVFGAEFTFTADPARTIEGVVRDAKSRQPMAGVAVDSEKLAGYPYSNHRVLKTVTDRDGRFRLVGMPKGPGNELMILPTDDQPYFMREIEVPDPVGLGPATVDIELHRGVSITGRITDKATGQPVPGVWLCYFPFRTNEFAQQTPGFDRDGLMHGDQSRYQTMSDGSFRLVGLPGKAVIGAKSYLKSYREGVGYDGIDAPKYQQSDWLDTYRNPISPSPKFPTVMKQINPPADATEFSVDLQLDPGASVLVRVIDETGTPLTGVAVAGLLSQGSFEDSQETVLQAINLGPKETRVVLLHHKEKNLGRALTIGPAEVLAGEVIAQLQPCATVTGQVLSDDGTPLSGLAIAPHVLPTGDFSRQLPSIATDAEGRFKTTLLPGASYTLAGMGGSFQYVELAKELTIHPGETKDLGTLKVDKEGKVAAWTK